MKPSNCESILIVDDDAAMLGALGKVFSSEGVSVSCTNSPREALDILYHPESRFDAVITDLRMPHMSEVMTGLTLIFAIHAIFPAIPIVVLTAYASPEIKEQCRLQGAAAFLEKPIDSQQLLTAVNNICRQGLWTG